MNNKSLIFSGFEPTPDLLQYLNERINQLEQEVPCDSFIDMKINSQSNHYHCDLKINCTGYHFVAASKEEHATDAAINVFLEIDKQLKYWHFTRFKDQDRKTLMGDQSA